MNGQFINQDFYNRRDSAVIGRKIMEENSRCDSSVTRKCLYFVKDMGSEMLSMLHLAALSFAQWHFLAALTNVVPAVQRERGVVLHCLSLYLGCQIFLYLLININMLSYGCDCLSFTHRHVNKT